MGFLRLISLRRPWIRVLGLVLLMMVVSHAHAVGQEGSVAPTESSPQAGPQDPALLHRALTKPSTLVIPEGKLKLDVMVDDAAGKPATGLQPWDFKILDNGQPRKVLSFRSYNGVQVKPDPPVEVILVVDTVNLLFQQMSFVRQQLDAFLRQNGGELKQPVTLVLLTEKGLRVQPRPSTDGNAIATVLDGVQGTVRVLDRAMGFEGQLEQFQVSTRALDSIAQNEERRPGRKLLIWVGWGWPILNRSPDYYSEIQQRRVFDAIVEMSTALRQARMTVYSVSPAGVYGPNPLLYQSFLKGVKQYKDADFGNLALKVLATQTGGKILGPDNNLVGQIDQCISDANAFYRISFDPVVAEHTDEYHELKLSVSQPGMTIRTDTGYYNQPTDH